MGSFYLEIEALGSYSGGNAPLLEILVDGVVVSSSSVTTSAASYGFTLDYTGNFPTSLSFRFSSSSGDPGDSISVNTARINGQDVTGNLSGTYIPRGGSVSVPPATIDHLFGRVEPSIGDLGAVDQSGTSGDDSIRGTDNMNGNVIDAGDGNDRVIGLDADDAINGGAADDLLKGENGSDIIIGSNGNDKIYGNDGDDLLYGQDDNDRLFGDNGNDTLNGGLGNDVLSGGNDDDILYGEDGADRMIGGNGNDIMYGDAGDDVLSGAAGDDRMYGGTGADKIVGGTGADIIDGGDNADMIVGQEGADTIDGGAGNDVLYGGDDADTINGGANDDEIRGEAGNDTLNGDAGLDTIYGGTGSDTIDGGADNDTILGGDGGDILSGGLGDDIIFSYVDTTSGSFLSQLILNDNPVAYWRLNETSGTRADNLGTLGSAVDGTYSGGYTQGSSALYGSGDVSVNFDGTNGLVSIPDSSSINTTTVTERTIELVFRADDVINQQVLYEEGGSTNSLAIYIEGGRVYFEGRDAGDWGPFGISAAITTGQVYHATLVLDQPNGEMRGYLDGALVGTGTITVPLSAHSGNIYIGGTSDGAVYHDGPDGSSGYNFDGRISDVAIYNSVLDDTTIQAHSDLANSSEVPEPLVADDGADTLNGDAGDDTLYAYGAGDTLNGGDDNDTLYGNDEINILSGDAGVDTIYGEDGADIINGGDGNDTIYGGEGSDIIQGGVGADTIFGDDLSAIVLEAGRTTVSQSSSTQWHTVSFTSIINDAVVKMFAEDVSGDPFTLRVRNITASGFEFQIDEYDYQDGITGPETISWIAVSAGSHTLENGMQIQAGFTQATDNTATTVSFEDSSYSNPIVLTQLSSDNELSAAPVRNYNVSGSGFTLELDEEEGNSRSHATEDVGWIAIDGGGSVGLGMLAGTTGDVVDDGTTTVSYGGTFGSSPILIADMQTLDGGDTASTVGVSIGTSSADIYIDEETSGDSETSHTNENVGYLALGQGTYQASGAGNADMISGGAGADDLYGGIGTDTFIFEALTAFSDVDTIHDFSTTAFDRIDLSDILSAYNPMTDVITDFVRITDSGANSIVEVDANGGADSFSQIATLINATGLTDEAALETSGMLITS